jgi:hypothetical protein
MRLGGHIHKDRKTSFQNPKISGNTLLFAVHYFFLPLIFLLHPLKYLLLLLLLLRVPREVPILLFAVFLTTDLLPRYVTVQIPSHNQDCRRGRVQNGAVLMPFLIFRTRSLGSTTGREIPHSKWEKLPTSPQETIIHRGPPLAPFIIVRYTLSIVCTYTCFCLEKSLPQGVTRLPATREFKLWIVLSNSAITSAK